MGMLSGLCLAISLWPLQAVRLVMPAVSLVAGVAQPMMEDRFSAALTGLTMISAMAALFLCLTLALVMLRRRLLTTRPISQTMTWDCGYAAPAASMQYTASSFAQPVMILFRSALRTQSHEQAPVGYFPESARLMSHTPDVASTYVFLPLFGQVKRGLEGLRWLQQGRVQLYLLYIFLTLVALLVWKLGV
jgi:hypothetical protein